ncbi:PREDICTED: DNA-directed RNA polymerase I subunit RPA34 [Odobenus rosmarus divergens]|uniref:DNA-directed RNA polymerase I subunit RPA34 n=1 Tax=Odobenus rosmarus divergens TaxID=9708 RepID=A0A2U3VZP2_ODORO|nr:PREDICTED: DNA-directed RNA polymerase I subunit RPA34 [Odobenus rosmarus divergens]
MAGTPSGGAALFSCPPTFTATSPASEPTRFSLEVLRDPDTELWLIQAPVNFAPDCLNGRLVPLLGSRIVKGKLAGKRHCYRVLRSSGPQAGEAILLASSGGAGGGLTCAPALQGSLRIFDGPQESPSGTLLQPIPASPPPQIPPGLRPRFCAFGGSLPVTGPGSVLELRSPASRKRKKKRHIPEASVPQEAVNGLGALEVDTALGSPEVDVGKKKKKQELKQLEVMEPVAAESMAEMSEPLGAPFLSTTKKKKKKPKGAEMVEPEEQTLVPEEKPAELELTIKREPLEEIVFSPSRKRKRQKGTEGREPGEGMPAESPLQLEPEEEANPLPSSKKKKKEKGYKVMMEPGTEATELEMGPLEFPGEVMEPELPHEVEPQAEAALVSTKKRRKKEKWQNAAGEPGAEVVEPWVEPEPPGDLEPQASTKKKKKKKERGHKATEPRAETSDPQGEVLELQLPDEGEPEARADPVPTKKRKKQGQGSGMPDTASQEMLEPPLSLESGEEVAPTGWEKKRKKLQQDPV